MDKYLITMEQLDRLEREELQRLGARTEYNRRKRETAVLVAALCEERRRRKRERDKHRKELNGMTAFITLISLLCVMVCCILSSAPWTAILAIICALAVMWKGGWIG